MEIVVGMEDGYTHVPAVISSLQNSLRCTSMRRMSRIVLGLFLGLVVWRN